MKNKAIFLDRDGVINKERGAYTYLPEDFELNHGLLENLWRLQRAGFLLVVVSNQSGIAKGLYKEADALRLHEMFLAACREKSIEIAAFYFCPHHPDSGQCLCRKPGSLMIEKALARFDVDAGKSFLIGDRERDVRAAEAVGVKGILVASNEDITAVTNRILQAS
ncbi:MAG: HAD family hydrolase [Flavobacteriales bacterium]|nr:HAD family hydrolase [Flavobacteriales bacterium]